MAVQKTYFLVLILFISTVASAVAQQSSVVSAMIQEASGNVEHLNKIIDEHEHLLKKYPHNEFAPTVMFQLAELHSQRSDILYSQKMEKYEHQLDRYENGGIDTEPELPAQDKSKTIYYCNQLIQNYPDLSFRDRVLYKLALAYLDEGQAGRAKETFERLVAEYPGTALALEAHFRIGEYYFGERKFAQAISHYKKLLKHWNNPYFDMSLYKLGWSYYNIEKYSDAISTFLYLIKDLNLLNRVESQKLDLSWADLRSEAIHYIASAFTEYGGPSTARDFLEPLIDKEFTRPILMKMAELYESRNIYAEAISTFHIILDFYPFSEKAPSVYERIIRDYELAERVEKANEVRETAVNYFGPNGTWTAHYSTQDSIAEAGLQSARRHLKHLGLYYQAKAAENGDQSFYRTAIQKYKRYIQEFPGEADTDTMHYYLADCYEQLGVYQKAGNTYDDIVERYHNSGYREEAAFNRILAWLQVYLSDEKKEQVTVKLAHFAGSSDTVSVSVQHKSQANVLRACNDFIRLFPKSEWKDQVYMKFGEMLGDLEEYNMAVRVYRNVFDMKNSRYRLAAAMNAAHCYYSAKEYKKAETLFNSIAEEFPDSTQRIENANKMAASANLKISSQLSRNGKFSDSAQLLTDVAKSVLDSTFREQALFNSAVQFQKAGRISRAARTFERLALEYPKSELTDKSLMQAATLWEERSELMHAASDFLRLADFYPESPFARRALPKAALCYELSGNWLAAEKVYKRCARAFPNDTDDVLQYLYKSGEMALKDGRPDDALTLFRKTVYTHNGLNDSENQVDVYFVARAQFMIGEILFSRYERLELKPPLKANLERKTASFKQVVQAFTQTIRYQVAEWSTASSHRIGMAFEEFVRAFEESPPPDHLTPEQKKVYQQKLKESAIPYKKKALETYSKNVQQAKAQNIQNSWIEKSRQRMLKLSEELEQSDMSITTLEKTAEENDAF